MTESLFNLALGFMSGIGFTSLINIPKRSILVASVISGVGWLLYNLGVEADYSKVTAAFLATIAIEVLSEVSSRIFKDAASVYIIPSILPLVPGAGMYYAMLAFVEKDYQLAASTANEVFFIAGAIALSLLATGSVMKMIFSIRDQIKKAINGFK